MLSPSNLRVIGSQRVFGFFVPDNGDPFPSAEFLLVPPSQAAGTFESLPADDALTVVLNPDDYSVHDVSLLGGTLWLWFLRVVAPISQTADALAPQLSQMALSDVKSRADWVKEFLNSTAGELPSFVVSDRATEEFFRSRGVGAVMSPPAVNQSTVMGLSVAGRTPGIATISERSRYANQFLDAAGTEVVFCDARSEVELKEFFSATHVVSLGSSVLPALSYESALSLVAGQTLISTAIDPLWGLEPGIDFIDVSTPAELMRVCEFLVRQPHATRLMSVRGQGKSSVFEASSIFRRLVARLGVSP